MRDFFSPETNRAYVLIALVCIFGATLKIAFFPPTFSSDYYEYVALSQYYEGTVDLSSPDVRPHRMLKPLNPLLIAGMAQVTDHQSAFIVQATIFYFAFIFAVFFFAREFFDDLFMPTLIAIYVALSYPILKYGVELLTETGALFFYVLSLYYTLRYLKMPSMKLVITNAAIVTIGFLWKEYSIVSAVIFGLAILFQSTQSIRTRAMQIAVYAGIFLAVHIPMQIYVYLAHGYTYLSWYSVAVHGAINQHEFTLRNIIKSTAALLGVLWLAVPLGFARYKELAGWQKRFLQVGLLPPFMGYAWGYISSRLLFVMAPPFLLVAALGMHGWSRSAQVSILVLAIGANIAWLFLSYQIKI